MALVWSMQESSGHRSGAKTDESLGACQIGLCCCGCASRARGAMMQRTGQGCTTCMSLSLTTCGQPDLAIQQGIAVKLLYWFVLLELYNQSLAFCHLPKRTATCMVQLFASIRHVASTGSASPAAARSLGLQRVCRAGSVARMASAAVADSQQVRKLCAVLYTLV